MNVFVSFIFCFDKEFSVEYPRACTNSCEKDEQIGRVAVESVGGNDGEKNYYD